MSDLRDLFYNKAAHFFVREAKADKKAVINTPVYKTSAYIER